MYLRVIVAGVCHNYNVFDILPIRSEKSLEVQGRIYPDSNSVDNNRSEATGSTTDAFHPTAFVCVRFSDNDLIRADKFVVSHHFSP